MTTALRASDVIRTYGMVRALDGADIEVAEGEIHGLIGPNGSGKSTFVDVLSGRARPTAGSVFLHGEDISRRSIRWRRLNGLSRAFQHTSVFPAMTVGEQLLVAAGRGGDGDLDNVVAALDLEGHLDSQCETIAYGDQRRVDIALALVGRPKVLLLDEPTAGLSRAESLAIADHIAGLVASWDISVLLVEHDMEVVFSICDRLTVLNLGKRLMTGTPDEVRGTPEVIRAYLGSQA